MLMSSSSYSRDGEMLNRLTRQDILNLRKLHLDPKKMQSIDNEHTYYYRVSRAYRDLLAPGDHKPVGRAISHSEAEAAFRDLLRNNKVYNRIHNQERDEAFLRHLGDYQFSLYDINQIITRAHEIQVRLEQLSGKTLEDAEDRYAKFIALAENLDHYYSEYRKQAIKDSQHRYQNPWKFYLYRLRSIRLQLFGHECLNDFEMRDMLSFGVDTENLDTVKYWDPLKWLCLFVATFTSAYIAGVKSLKYHVVKTLIGEYNLFQDDDEYALDYARRIVAGIGIALALIVGALSFPQYMLTIFCLGYGLAVMLENITLLLAMPYNMVLRPIIQFVEEHPQATAGILAYKGGTLILTYLICSLYAPLAAFIHANEANMFGLSCLFGPATTYLTFKLNKDSPGSGFFFGTIYSFALTLFFSGNLLAIGALAYNPVIAVYFVSYLFGLAETIVDLIDVDKRFMGNILEMPEPRKPVEKEFRHMIKDAGVNLTYVSHRFFNTRLDARERRADKRDFISRFEESVCDLGSWSKDVVVGSVNYMLS